MSTLAAAEVQPLRGEKEGIKDANDVGGGASIVSIIGSPLLVRVADTATRSISQA